MTIDEMYNTIRKLKPSNIVYQAYHNNLVKTWKVTCDDEGDEVFVFLRVGLVNNKYEMDAVISEKEYILDDFNYVMTLDYFPKSKDIIRIFNWSYDENEVFYFDEEY